MTPFTSRALGCSSTYGLAGSYTHYSKFIKLRKGGFTVCSQGESLVTPYSMHAETSLSRKRGFKTRVDVVAGTVTL
jgi:hypothetical protein